jgi:cell division protein FtsI (penicillin-binding protein 3)
LWRVYLCFIGMTLLGFMVLGRVAQIQVFQGKEWRAMGDSLHQSVETLDAERGTIYSEDGEMLSSSIPYFDIHIDFRTEGLRDMNGKIFFKNIDSLGYQLSRIFPGKTKKDYVQELTRAYRSKASWYELKKDVPFDQFKKLRSFPLVRLGAYKSGFVIESKEKRMNPFGLLANRTIGLSRDPKLNIGLEKYYDSILKGQTGSRIVRYISGGTRVPIDGSQIEPINGRDITTTLNVQIQDITQNALLKMMQEQEAISGCAVVMEVSTGKIKAIANLGRQKDGTYWEDNNYALVPSEPGSTIKLVTLFAALEDGFVNINSTVEINGGAWEVNGRSIRDAERSPKNVLTYKEAFEHSSNVAFSKLAYYNYQKQPAKFVKHYTRLGLAGKTGIDLNDPYKPLVKQPGKNNWSAQTIVSMGFGYELTQSPMHTLMMYNAIANNGRMMKPYLVSTIRQGEDMFRQVNPVATNEKICSPATLQQLRICLQAVCDSGTAKKVFDSCGYKVAGKTGTTKVADGVYSYDDAVYQSSFVGYFPADRPRYSCIVVIKNKPHAVKYFGGAVAAPVFLNIANRLMVLGNEGSQTPLPGADSATVAFRLNSADAGLLLSEMKTGNTVVDQQTGWARIIQNGSTISAARETPGTRTVPDVKGMGLRDALNCLENRGIRVMARGRGRVALQSILPGTAISKNTTITIELK